MANRFSIAWEKFTSPTSTLRYFPEELLKTTRKIGQFFAPESEEEAKKRGLLPIRKRFQPEGEILGYFDPIGAISGIKRVVPKAISATQTSVQKVITALKGAKSLRKVQETLYTVEKAKRFEAAQRVGKKITGEAGFFAEKARLRGELPKVEFESIRKQIGQTDIDNLFVQIKESPMISEWDKLSAREGLTKLFGRVGGKVPTEGEIGLLNKVFPKELTSALLAKRPFWDKLGEAAGQLANIPRSVMSSFDLSFGGRQGIFVAPRFRKEFFRSWLKQFRMFGSEKAYQAVMDDVARNPLFELANDSGVSFTNIGRVMSQREERFMSQWAEKIPIVGIFVKASARAYTGFANKFRMDIFASMVKNAERLGRNPNKDRDLTKGIANFVNSATGRGSLGVFERSATILNAFFFSPRLTSARLRLIVPLEYIKADPFVRKEYLKSLFTYTGTVMTVLGLAKLAGAEVGADPRSADFLKIKIGNTRIDIMGGFQQYIRLAGQLFSGEIVSTTTGKVIKLGEGYRPLTHKDVLLRFAEYKQAPLFSFLTGFMEGRDFKGDPFSTPKEIGKRFIPMAIQDIYDIATQQPELLPASVLGIFGIGLQTYGPKGTKTQPGVNRFSF